jgi:hypothetical protein
LPGDTKIDPTHFGSRGNEPQAVDRGPVRGRGMREMIRWPAAAGYDSSGNQGPSPAPLAGASGRYAEVGDLRAG